MEPTLFKKGVVVPLLMVFGTMLMAANSFDVGIFRYNVIGDGVVSVSQIMGEEGARLNPDPYVGELVIPSSVDNGGVTYTVTTIAENAFSGCSKLTSVSIPASIKAMHSNAFTGCTGLAASLNAANFFISFDVFSTKFHIFLANSKKMCTFENFIRSEHMKTVLCAARFAAVVCR